MRKCLLFLFLFLAVAAVAQDYHFSTFHHSPLNLSPSESGNFDGSYRITGIQRDQWRSITQPYQTFGIGVDAANFLAVKSLGAGLQLVNDLAGDGAFQEFHLQLPISYGFKLSSDSATRLRLGIVPAIIQNSIDFSQLSFDQQFSGSVYNPNAPTGENLANNNFLRFNLGAGVSLSHNFNALNRLNFQLGFFNLVSPSQDFLTEVGEIPMRFSAALSGTFKLLPGLHLHPSVIVMQQKNFRQGLLGSELSYILNKSRFNYVELFAGIHHRVNAAVIPSIGAAFTRLSVRGSYDIQTNALSDASNRRGGFEVSLIYIFDKAPPARTYFQQCPSYL